jgi:hypothetical protein
VPVCWDSVAARAVERRRETIKATSKRQQKTIYQK